MVSEEDPAVVAEVTSGMVEVVVAYELGIPVASEGEH